MSNYVAQWYWQTAKMYPYEKSKVFYHGPREKWMKLIKDDNTTRKEKRKRVNRTTRKVS